MCRTLCCLMSLVLVLCLAGNAGAYTWTAFGDGSSWNDVDNWDTTDLPNSTERVNTSISGTVVIDGYAAYAYKGAADAVTMTIRNGGSLTMIPYLDVGSAYYSLDGATGDGGSYWTVDATSLLHIDQIYMGYNGQSTLDVYGTVLVDRDPGSAFVFAGKATAYGLLNMYAGGTADFTNWAALNGGTGHVEMYGGSIIIDGEITAAPTDVTISFAGGGPGLWNYDSGTGRTTIMVPEPATVALLGLGGLALLRKKR